MSELPHCSTLQHSSCLICLLESQGVILDCQENAGLRPSRPIVAMAGAYLGVQSWIERLSFQSAYLRCHGVMNGFCLWSHCSTQSQRLHSLLNLCSSWFLGALIGFGRQASTEPIPTNLLTLAWPRAVKTGERCTTSKSCHHSCCPSFSRLVVYRPEEQPDIMAPAGAQETQRRQLPR